MKSFVFATCVVLAACGDTTTTNVTQINLDRPVDVAFACFGGLRITGGGAADPKQPIVRAAQPPLACDIRSAEATITPPPGQEDLTKDGGDVIPNPFWYALILQHGPGTLAVANFPTRPTFKPTDGAFNVQDADPRTPGVNGISIGEEPIGVITDTLGCSAITANAGSCDLSALDLTTALDFDGYVNTMRFEVKNGLGQPIRSKPAAIVGERKSEVIGDYCPAQAPGATAPVLPQGLAYIAYPSCHIVAGVDLATGTIVTGVQYSSTGVASIITDPSAISCPDECGIDTTRTPGPRPVTIDLEFDERFQQQRMVIGSENTNAITVVELDDTSRPVSLQSIALEGDVGVNTLAMSPVVAVGGAGGLFDQTALADYQYVYAIASDQTVRVVEVQSLRSECDVQADPRFLRTNQDAPTLGCLRVGATTTPPRRAGARSPGIDLGADQVPIGVDFFKTANPNADYGEPLTMIGHFAVISSTTGETFVVTVDDDGFEDQFTPTNPFATPMVRVIPHTLRDGGRERDFRAVKPDDPGKGQPLCDDESVNPADTSNTIRGGPRATALPAKNLAGIIPAEKALQLPSVRQLNCVGVDTEGMPATRLTTELGFMASDAQRDLAFPDWFKVALDEQLSLAYEGSLSQDRADTAANGPQVRESMLYVDQNGMHLRDQTRPFCDAGVEPFDIVQMRGCDPSLASTDCPIGYSCYVHPQSQVAGLGACMLRDEAERLADACKDFLTSVRRYTVVRADSGELLLTTRRHELRSTPLDGCTDDAQCELLGDIAKRGAAPEQPVDQSTVVDEREWVCRADPTRKPRANGSNRRCNMACDTTAQCATGTVCVGGNEATPARDGLCMEGVVPPQSCVNAPQRYELRAGEAFVFLGARTGFVHPIEANAAGQCVKPADANPYLTSRIPLDPPACDPTADPISGRRPDGTFEPNPCATTVQHFERVPNYAPGTCTLLDSVGVVREREAPAIRYRSRGMTFSIVDPYYPGDQTCITDRLGPNGTPLDRIPTVFHGYSVGFRVQAGFNPIRLDMFPTLPVKVLRGPLQSIWVVDQGDFLSTSIGAASTRGAIFRSEPTNFALPSIRIE